MELKENLKEGGYAKQQVFSPFKILRWSHQQRFKKGKALVQKYRPEVIADYGCGDGTFLSLLDKEVKKRIGLEIDPNQLDYLSSHYSEEKGLSFAHVSSEIEDCVDMATCFEVLEHCEESVIEEVLGRLSSLVRRDGRVIISVPKETGLTMIGKQGVRRLLALRKYGNYEHSEWYTFKEFFQMLFATKDTEIERRFIELGEGSSKYKMCGHKGFNWKLLKETIEKYFILEYISFTPGLVPGGFISSQVWFECKNSK